MPTKEISTINYNGTNYILVDATASTRFSPLDHHHTVSEIDGEIASYSFASPIVEDNSHNVSLNTVPVGKGGTGVTTITSGQALIGNGTDAIVTKAIDSTVATATTNSNLITSGAVRAALNNYAANDHQHTSSEITDLIVHTFTSPLSENVSTHQVSLTTVPVSKGGTGSTSLASGEVLIGNGTNTVSTRAISTSVGTSTTNTNLITAGAVYNVVQGLSPLDHQHTVSEITDYLPYAFTAPLSEAVGTTSRTISLNTVSVNKGGTGVTTITSGEVMIGNGSGAIVTRGIDSTVSTSTTSTNLITSGAVRAALNGYASGDHHHTISEIDDLVVHTFASPLSENSSTHEVTLGTVSVNKGGTGTTSLASGEVLIGNGTGAVSTRAIATSVGTSSTNTNLITAGAVYSAVNAKAAADHQHTVSEITDFVTNSTYNSSTNKIATMNDVEITTITYSLISGSGTSADYEMLISSVAATNYAQSILGEAY